LLGLFFAPRAVRRDKIKKVKFFCKRNLVLNLYNCGCAITVLNTAVRILRDTQRAQDVHQEVFLEIWRRWHKYNGQTNWGAYLYRVTVRKAIESAKRPRMEPLAEGQPEYAAKNEKPDGRLRAAELQQRIVEGLAGLPKRQADVFVLSRIEGLKPERIAEVLGCSQETVRVHLHRAMKRLARELRDYLGKD
jgi:RNA polymerase sigma-70 factor (ECF subfamily)